MSLARAARRTVRRGLNAFRTTVLFWSRPSLVLLDMIEAALLWAGCPDDRAIDVTQACALGFASTWFLVVGWALWRHPVATPSAATAIGTSGGSATQHVPAAPQKRTLRSVGRPRAASWSAACGGTNTRIHAG